MTNGVYLLLFYVNKFYAYLHVYEFNVYTLLVMILSYYSMCVQENENMMFELQLVIVL